MANATDRPFEPVDPMDAEPQQESNWWSNRPTAAPAGAPAGVPITTPTEDMDRYRHVPLIGRVPGRVVAIAAAAVLAVAVLALLGLATGRSMAAPDPMPTEAVANLARAAQEAATGAPLDATQTTEALAQIDAWLSAPVSNGTPTPAQQAARSAWAAHRADWMALPKVAPLALSAVAGARAAGPSLAQTVAQAAPYWRAAAATNEWASVSAVNLSQALAAVQELAVSADAVAQGAPVPDRWTTDRQNIEQALRAAAAAPDPAASNLGRAWGALAQGYAAARPALDQVQGNAAAWNALRRAAPDVAAFATAAAQAQPAPASHAPSGGVLLVGLLAVAALAVLVGASTRQERWSAHAAEDAADQLRAAVDRARLQADPLASGRLDVHWDDSHPALSPLMGALNRSVRRLRRLIGGWRSASSAAQAVWDRVVVTAPSVLDAVRLHTEQAQSAHATARALAQPLNGWAHAAAEAAEHAEAVHAAITPLHETADRAHQHVSQASAAATDAHQHAERLSATIADMHTSAVAMHDVADHMAVLAIQAAIQAAKAGPTGAGFQVVADSLRELAATAARVAQSAADRAAAARDGDQAALTALTQAAAESGAATAALEQVLESVLTASQRAQEWSLDARARSDEARAQERTATAALERLSDEVGPAQTHPDIERFAAALGEMEGALHELRRAETAITVEAPPAPERAG